MTPSERQGIADALRAAPEPNEDQRMTPQQYNAAQWDTLWIFILFLATNWKVTLGVVVAVTIRNYITTD